MRRKILAGLAAGLLMAQAAVASPLASGNWIQVGNMSGSGGMFNGNCNLSSTCSYAIDADGDFWNSFATSVGQQMLFITGNGLIWVEASYSAIYGLVTQNGGVQAPNITWTSVGRGGVEASSPVTGNILFRSGNVEDPWIQIEGIHCSVGYTCTDIIWGESNYGGNHPALKNANGGVRVYVSAVAPVPVPAAGGLLVAALAGLGLLRRRKQG